MTISKPVLLISLICLTVQSFSFAQSDKVNCASIKDGNFYAYSNIYGSMVLKRAGARQQEINAASSDTMNWKVAWLSNCVYALQYESGFKSDKALIALYKKHKRIINVTDVTDEYYLYKSYMDNVIDTDLPNDTMWRKEQDFSNRQIATDSVNEASFSGGEEGWKAYITKVITRNSKALVKDGESGTCYIILL